MDAFSGAGITRLSSPSSIAREGQIKKTICPLPYAPNHW
jgi:hypothetical protein